MAHSVMHFEVVRQGPRQAPEVLRRSLRLEHEEDPRRHAVRDGREGGRRHRRRHRPDADGNGHVTFYVGTDDPQATLDKAEQLGGKTILPVTELPEVTIALFADPEGHVVGLAKGM